MRSSASGVEGRSAGEVANELCRRSSCGVAGVQRNVCVRIDCDRDSSCERSSTKSCHDVQGVRTAAGDGLLGQAASFAPPPTLPSSLPRRQRDPSGDTTTHPRPLAPAWGAGVARTASLGCSSCHARDSRACASRLLVAHCPHARPGVLNVDAASVHAVEAVGGRCGARLWSSG